MKPRDDRHRAQGRGARRDGARPALGALKALVAVWNSTPWAIMSFTSVAASALRRCAAGITQPYTGPSFPLLTARLFLIQ